MKAKTSKSNNTPATSNEEGHDALEQAIKDGLDPKSKVTRTERVSADPVNDMPELSDTDKQLANITAKMTGEMMKGVSQGDADSIMAWLEELPFECVESNQSWRGGVAIIQDSTVM